MDFDGAKGKRIFRGNVKPPITPQEKGLYTEEGSNALHCKSQKRCCLAVDCHL